MGVAARWECCLTLTGCVAQPRAQLEALEDPTPINFVIPIISSLAFIFVLGYAAVRVVPNFLANQIVPRLPKNHLEDSLLGLVLLCGTVLMAACHYGRSSHLLGAFLGGLMFCTLSSVKSVWHNKVKPRLLKASRTLSRSRQCKLGLSRLEFLILLLVAHFQHARVDRPPYCALPVCVV